MPRLLKTVLLLASATFVFSSCHAPRPTVATTVPGPEYIDRYGGLHFALTSGGILTNGFDVADVVEVEVTGNREKVPLVADYRHVSRGDFALVAPADSSRPVFLTIYHGDAAATLGVKQPNPQDIDLKATFPIPVAIRLVEKGGYASQIPPELPKRSPNRKDYPSFDDARFANFREIRAPRIAPGLLYRSSSPINPSLGRAKYADAAAAGAGVKAIVNMVDTEKEAKALSGWDGSYSSKCEILFRPMGVDVTSQDFSNGIADSLRFIAKAPLPVLLHCKEGKDRTGFISAVLELLQGASLDDVVKDYSKTFADYAGTQLDPVNARRLRADLVGNLNAAFGCSSIEKAKDLPATTRKYLERIGMTSCEINALGAKLAGDGAIGDGNGK